MQNSIAGRRLACAALLLRVGASAAVLLVISTLGAGAAVAPEYQRMRQFHAAMTVGSEAAARLGPHGLIDRIEAVGNGTFRFWAKNCFIPVVLAVEPDPVGSRVMPGAPPAYRASLGEVRCN